MYAHGRVRRDLLLPSLQDAVRHGDVPRAVTIVKNMKGTHSEIVDRLALICVLEIGIASPVSFAELFAFGHSIKAPSKSEESIRILCRIVQVLCRLPKSSFVRNVLQRYDDGRLARFKNNKLPFREKLEIVFRDEKPELYVSTLIPILEVDSGKGYDATMVVELLLWNMKQHDLLDDTMQLVLGGILEMNEKSSLFSTKAVIPVIVHAICCIFSRHCESPDVPLVEEELEIDSQRLLEDSFYPEGERDKLNSTALYWLYAYDSEAASALKCYKRHIERNVRRV